MGEEQSKFFRFIQGIARIFIPKHETIWEYGKPNEPSVFVCNHDRAYGPAVVYSWFEKNERLRPWVSFQMCFAKEIPRYARRDNWWKPNQWYTPILDYTLPYLAAYPSQLIMKGVCAIPVFHDMRISKTMKESIEALENGEDILIFPESSSGYNEYNGDMHNGFVLLAIRYFKKTGKELAFYPSFANKNNRTIKVGKRIRYDSSKSNENQKQKIAEFLELEMNRLKIE